MGKLCLMVLVSVCACGAQNSQALRGEIQTDAVEDLSWLQVRLDVSAPFVGESATVSYRGDFEFDNVPAGSYTLRVIDQSGREIVSQLVNVGPGCPPVLIRLSQARLGARPTGQTVSVMRLRHKVPKQAMKAAEKAQKLSSRGDHEGALEQWRKAVAADPEFSQAYGNIGSEYLRLNRPAQALEAYRKAIALDPSTAAYETNLALALGQLGQYTEAEAVARRSLQLDDTSPRAHYVLGCILVMSGRTTPEAIQQLQIASRQFPPAHAALAEIYRVEGHQDLASAELEQYRQQKAASKAGSSSKPQPRQTALLRQ